ncbi:histone deacetylase 8-like isoform X1 [Vanessa cardui]|uniref:histone deacetylase 8-like isoform X1 n=1 Tax=Vanessa cardui TaxID=171605 RepID=UPI001F14303D|nr:histone deacetylase 8-like isoform X1 [Vanessa cardui]
MNKRKVAYIWEQDLIQFSDRLPAVLGRASMVHSLITAYGLLNHIKVIRSQSASYSELKLFHSELYLDHLKSFTHIEDDYVITAKDEKFGLGYDCPPYSDMYNSISSIAGGSLTAAKCLVMNMADIAINWCGGWHHAHKNGAEGFCYVNDIVIAIEKLRTKFSKILYIDLDVHHGNGVQDAYNLSKSVFTLSFHKYEPGFYPGSGKIEDIGRLNGKGYACNIPFHALYSDDTFVNAFDSVFTMVYSSFLPDAIVVQCGADALARDSHGGAGLTLDGYCLCIKEVLNVMKPTLLLGGGGYNHANAARLWTSITALVVDQKLDDNIPEHSFWTQYGSDYTLNIQPLLTKDLNSKKYVDECVTTVKGTLYRYLNHNEEDFKEPIKKRRKIELHDDNSHEAKRDSILKEQLVLRNVQNEKASLIMNFDNKLTNPNDVYDFID